MGHCLPISWVDPPTHPPEPSPQEVEDQKAKKTSEHIPEEVHNDICSGLIVKKTVWALTEKHIKKLTGQTVKKLKLESLKVPTDDGTDEVVYPVERNDRPYRKVIAFSMVLDKRPPGVSWLSVLAASVRSGARPKPTGVRHAAEAPSDSAGLAASEGESCRAYCGLSSSAEVGRSG